MRKLTTLSIAAVLAWATMVTAADSGKKPELAAPPPASVVVTPKLDWDIITGSRARAGLYVKPFSGAAFDIGFLDLRTGKGFDAVDLWARDLFSSRYDATLALWCPGTPIMVRGVWDRASFYPEPLAPVPAAWGARAKTQVETRIWPVGKMRLTARYTHEHVYEPGLLRETVFNHFVDEANGSIDLPLGPGLLTFRLGNLAVSQRVAGRLGSNSQMYEMGYQVVPGSRWTIGTVAQWTSIKEPGLPSSDLFNSGLTATYQPSRNLWTEGRLFYRSFDLRATQNAYLRKSMGGGLRLTWQPIRQVGLRFGSDYTDMERLNAVQTGIDRPQEARLWARMDYTSGLRGTRGTLSYEHRQLANLNPNAVPNATLTAPLFADREDRVDARVSSLVGDSGLAYGFWQFRRRGWHARQVQQTVNNAGIGATGPVSRNITLSGDLYYRSLSTNQIPLRQWAGDALVGHVGIGYTPSQTTRLWVDYYRNSTWKGEATDQDVFSAGFEASFGRGRALRLTYSHDGLENSTLPALPYKADVVQFSFSMPF